MRKLLLLLIVGFATTGCLGRDKIEVVCEDIIRAVDVDPRALTINSTSTLASKLEADSVRRHYAHKFPDGIPPASQRMMSHRIDRIDEYRDIFVAVDYTTKNRMGGPLRDKALCRYFDWGDEKELVSLTVHNKDYGHDDFLMMFLGQQRPKGLSSHYMVK